MTPLGKFTLRLSIYGAVLGYLAADLFLFQGPIRKKINRATPFTEEAKALAMQQQIVARVFGYKINQQQLERALHERLWREGKTPSSLSPSSLKLARYAALNDLIDHELLRIKAKAHSSELIIEPSALEARYARFTSRFESPQELASSLRSQGIADETALKERIHAQLQQEKYVELKIAPNIKVSEEEALAWFQQNQNQLTQPERIEARHIFIPTLDPKLANAKNQLELALEQLKTGTKDFQTLARELSEDPATQNTGGYLGWMTRERTLHSIANTLFELPLHQPSLVQSHLGWHLIEITQHKAKTLLPFEAVRESIFHTIITTKRLRAIEDYRNGLRQFEATKIEVFHNQIQHASPPPALPTGSKPKKETAQIQRSP